MTQSLTPEIQAWIYPGDPSCSAMQEMADGRSIAVLKPQYFTLQETGILTPVSASVCNGPSALNLALVKAHSQRQFITISGSIEGMTMLHQQRALATTCTETLVSFLEAHGFTGVEWDIEGVSSWSLGQYNAYKEVITEQIAALHAHGLQVMIDGPSIINATYQGYYPNFRYEDFETAVPVDKIVIMCYDFQNDQGNGTPVGSLADIAGCCHWMKARISDPSRVVIGINSYGYAGLSGAYTAITKTHQQLQQISGFTTARRDASSGELLWASNGMTYDYSDSQTLDGKLAAILAQGYSQVSVWHLGGGNPWFSGAHPLPTGSTPVTPIPPTIPAPSTTPEQAQPAAQDPMLAAFQRAYPGFGAWYDAHFDAGGNFLG